jgi:hypothetical protein
VAGLGVYAVLPEVVIAGVWGPLWAAGLGHLAAGIGGTVRGRRLSHVIPRRKAGEVDRAEGRKRPSYRDHRRHPGQNPGRAEGERSRHRGEVGVGWHGLGWGNPHSEHRGGDSRCCLPPRPSPRRRAVLDAHLQSTGMETGYQLHRYAKY